MYCDGRAPVLGWAPHLYLMAGGGGHVHCSLCGRKLGHFWPNPEDGEW